MYQVLFDLKFKFICLMKFKKKLKEIHKNITNLKEYHV